MHDTLDVGSQSQKLSSHSEFVVVAVVTTVMPPSGWIYRAALAGKEGKHLHHVLTCTYTGVRIWSNRQPAVVVIYANFNKGS